MKTPLVLVFVAVAWLAAGSLAPAPARADNLVEPDFAAIAGRACDQKKQPATRFCAWKPYANKQYPRQYFITALGVDPCKDLAAVVTAKGSEASLDDRDALSKLCKEAGVRLVAAETFSDIGINLVLGLGDLIQEEAKQEIIDYLIDQIGRRFCKLDISIADGTPRVKFADWFTHSCKVILPDGVDGSVSAEAFSFGALKAAFRTDLERLPRNMGGVLTGWLDVRWGENAKIYVAAVSVLLYAVFEYEVLRKGPFEIVQELGDRANATSELASLVCDFTIEQHKVSKECVAVLLFELAHTSAIDLQRDRTTPIATIVGDTLDEFCRLHGPSDDKKQHGTCVISLSDYAAWHDRLKQFYRAIKRTLSLRDTIEALGGLTPREVAHKVAPEVVDALRGLVDSFSTIVVHLPSVSDADADRLRDDTAVIDHAVDVFDAVVADDPTAFSKALLDLLASKLVARHLSQTELRAFTVVAALATAKDRAAVKDILKEVAAPVGTYKMKYGADHTILTLNGFAGFFVGWEWTVRNKRPDGASDDRLRSADLPLKLSAPIGFDATFTSGRSCWHLDEPGSCYNIGATLTLIDPLALAVSTAHDTISADWKTLFEPGLYVRIGLLRSPIALLIGGNYQPGIRSPDHCGDARCSQGALQFGALLSADVPIFVLH
ncbi:MAG TPA: hypothetical protein VFK02_20670 [Kofleriaceae bacterium]|nr:hypothetical protein [Kofleriaceae bacterium]